MEHECQRKAAGQKALPHEGQISVEFAGVIVAGAVGFCVDRVSHESLRARFDAGAFGAAWAKSPSYDSFGRRRLGAAFTRSVYV